MSQTLKPAHPPHKQDHPHGIVGVLWRICDPASVGVGHCFMRGRLKKGDLWLATAHTGNCFQDYMFVEEFTNCLIGRPKWRFGSYGIGDSVRVELSKTDLATLRSGGKILLDAS